MRFPPATRPHELLDELTKSSRDENPHTTLMGIYADLTTGGVSTRVAADLVGVPRATATRKPHPGPRQGGRTGEQARLR